MPMGSKELIELEAYAAKCEEELDVLVDAIESNKARDQFLSDFRYLVSDKDFSMAMRAYVWPKDMMATLARAHGKVTGRREASKTSALCLGRLSKYFLLIAVVDRCFILETFASVLLLLLPLLLPALLLLLLLPLSLLQQL